MKYPITGKATVCDNGMQMGIEILKLTESLNSDSGAGQWAHPAAENEEKTPEQTG
jgi:hypothetical protein